MFHYFGYGSNMNRTSLGAKGVEPLASTPAVLPTQRYLNILVHGALEARLDPHYVEWLRNRPVKPDVPVPPFVHPSGDYPVFTASRLADFPLYTALDGAVFDMTNARPMHEFLKGFFGGRDMTLFHLRRLDTSDGRETIDDVRLGRLTPHQRRHLDRYLQEYQREYEYVGRFRYGD